jgi:hypothetical protein
LIRLLGGIGDEISVVVAIANIKVSAALAFRG